MTYIPEAEPMKLHDYARLPPGKQADFRKEWVSVSKKPPNGQIGAIEAKLHAFEAQYSMTTDEMLVSFKAGKLKDTADIAQWLIFSKAARGSL